MRNPEPPPTSSPELTTLLDLFVDTAATFANFVLAYAAFAAASRAHPTLYHNLTGPIPGMRGLLYQLHAALTDENFQACDEMLSFALLNNPKADTPGHCPSEKTEHPYAK